MKYDNTRYWTDIHINYHGKLKSVGWSAYCEEYNKLFYQSQTQTVLDTFNAIQPSLSKKKTSILDVGAGIAIGQIFFILIF